MSSLKKFDAKRAKLYDTLQSEHAKYVKSG